MKTPRGWIRAICEILLTVNSIAGHVSAAATPWENSNSLIKRALPDPPPPGYVDSVLNRLARWLTPRLDEAVDGRFYPYEEGHHVVGVKDLRGCTAVVIPSDKGVFVAHVWEIPVFRGSEREQTLRSEATFLRLGFESLVRGNPDCTSLASLVGTDETPGPMHRFYHPEVHVITPYTTRDEQRQGIHTPLRYEQYANLLAHRLQSLVGGITPGGIVRGYFRGSAREARSRSGTVGRAFLEYDTNELPPRRIPKGPQNPEGKPWSVLEGKWRLWVGPSHNEEDERIFRWRVVEDRPAAGSGSGSGSRGSQH
ncbi:MAG: hypothetical protein M1821_001058 [Bathelium mastoideum]|nr:MAG: hypothetical protein M1821_001058 [Bathelium mastoideum]